MEKWTIADLNKKTMEDVNYKKILFHFTDDVADDIREWFSKIELNHTSRWEDCRTNYFFYVENCDLQYVNTDLEEELIYLLAEGFSIVEIVA